MTRYSRSALPGRSVPEPRDEPQNTDGLDRLVFGGKRKPANDSHEPDFLPAMEDDNDHLVARANADRRNGAKERRTLPVPDRRAPTAGRRTSEYAPLRDEGAGRTAPDDGKRGPLLLVGALLIVVVFAVVVWNAYRDGLQGDEVDVAPELSTAGSFKTPPRMVEPAPIVTDPTEIASDTALDGGASPLEASDEQRPIPLTPAQPLPPAKPAEAAAATPPASKYTAPAPTPLKQPAPAATVPTPKPPAVKPTPVVAKPAIVAAAIPTPAKPAAPATPLAPGTSGFAAYGDHVVQIAATSSEATANSEWTKMLKAYPELLTGGEKFIQQADVNGKTVYRLRVGSFASKADAATFCAAFKARGGNCYPALK